MNNTKEFDVLQRVQLRPDHRRTVLLSASMKVCHVDLAKLETLPESLVRAMADFKAGRIVNMDIALNQPPPSKTG